VLLMQQDQGAQAQGVRQGTEEGIRVEAHVGNISYAVYTFYRMQSSGIGLAWTGGSSTEADQAQCAAL
jgi:hypothetical protein